MKHQPAFMCEPQSFVNDMSDFFADLIVIMLLFMIQFCCMIVGNRIKKLAMDFIRNSNPH